MPQHGTRSAAAGVRAKLVVTTVALATLALCMTGLSLQTMRVAHAVETEAREIEGRIATGKGASFARDVERQAVLVRRLTVGTLASGVLVAAALFYFFLGRLALQKAHLALAASDARRRAFLVDAGHELRIPLTIIRGEAQVALRYSLGTRTEATEALERILEQTRSVIRLLEDVFLISRAEAGGLHMDLQRVDAGGIAERTASDVSTIAREAGAIVLCHVEPDLPVLADADRLRQAIAALIDNALRHTRKGVTVVVEARTHGREVLLFVSDNGPGIDPLLAPRLFERFVRGHTRSEGSGLGLAVVRALIEAFQGTVHFETAPGGGARFCVRLPRAPEHGCMERRGAHGLTAAG